MKVCPVCNETFPEELRFCDLDGAKLHRDGASTAQAQGKLWSLLGIGVVLGSLVIIALAILFSPTTPAPVSSFTPSTPSSSEAKPVMADAASSYQPEVVEEEIPTSELKKKDKSLDTANGNTNPALVNPKAATQTEEDKAAGQPATAEIKEPAQPEPKKVESASPGTVKAAAESSESSKTAATKAEPKKETKPSKDSADKKQAESKDKKKGGFLNVFRKIFGGKKEDEKKKN